MSRLEKFLGQIIWFWAGLKWNDKFIGTAIFEWVAQVFARFVMLVMEHIEDGFKPLLKDLMDKVEETADVPPELQPLLDEIKSPTKPVAAFLGQAAAGGATGGLIQSTLGPALKLYEYNMLRLFPTLRIDIMTALALRFRTPLAWPDLYEDLKDQGWTDTRIDYHMDAVKTLLEADELTRHTLRFDMPEGGQPAPTGDYITSMYKLGYKEPEARRFFDQFLHYPTPQDLIRFQAKEVFEPDMVTRYGLDAEAGAIERDPFYRGGMTDEQIQNYWRAHWEHASWGQVTEMLHRGILTERTGAPEQPTTREAWGRRDAEGLSAMYDYYRLVEIPPFWRDKLTRMSYHPLTRVDVRRIHKLGLLSDEELYSSYRILGYDDAGAAKMTEFTQAYNTRTGTEADRDLTKTDVLRSYRERLITQIAAHDLLSDLGYGEDEITFLLDLNERSAAARTRDLTLSQVKNLYQLGLRSKSQVSAFLAAFGYDAEEIAALYDLWEWERPAATRQPSRTDIDRFIAAGIIDLATWSAEYTRLGYDLHYQEWYLAYLIETGKIE